MDFLKKWDKFIGDILRTTDSMFWSAATINKNVIDASASALYELGTDPAKLKARLSAAGTGSLTGLTLASLQNYKPVLTNFREVSEKVDIILHIIMIGLGIGAEYFVDRRKDFSFVKATLYYCALYGFTVGALHQRAIIEIFKAGEASLETVP